MNDPSDPGPDMDPKEFVTWNSQAIAFMIEVTLTPDSNWSLCKYQQWVRALRSKYIYNGPIVPEVFPATRIGSHFPNSAMNQLPPVDGYQYRTEDQEGYVLDIQFWPLPSFPPGSDDNIFLGANIVDLYDKPQFTEYTTIPYSDSFEAVDFKAVVTGTDLERTPAMTLYYNLNLGRRNGIPFAYLGQGKVTDAEYDYVYNFDPYNP